MSVPKLPSLNKCSSAAFANCKAQAKLNAVGHHSPPAYLRDSWEYSGRVKVRHYLTNSKEDTQLWHPILAESVSSRILNWRRKETLQDSLKSPARQNIARLTAPKMKLHWKSAFKALPRKSKQNLLKAKQP